MAAVHVRKALLMRPLAPALVMGGLGGVRRADGRLLVFSHVQCNCLSCPLDHRVLDSQDQNMPARGLIHGSVGEYRP
jgi:hypothetical protein